MHDPSNVLKHHKSLSVQVVLPESAQLLVSSPPPAGSSGKRKVSLMPLVTEDDLRRSNMGHRDPISVAQYAYRTPAHSPLPYDCKEKMLRRRLSPENTLLPFEIRDESVPEGVPTVKVRRKPMSLRLAKEGSPSLPGSPPAAAATATSNNYEDVAVALSPVQLKFPSLPASIPSTTQLDFGGLGVELDIAASHPDMIHFQQVLNDWYVVTNKYNI
uniref:Uncharacterized protein n=1 Tax=Ditylenchus dipsaci TaxID=166011 RepID=A0A915D7G1_9BILA